MRFADYFQFQQMINDPALGVVTSASLKDVLNANRIDYGIFNVDTIKIEDADLDSLLIHAGWEGETHCALYRVILMKSRSVGATTLSLGHNSNVFNVVDLVKGIDLNQLADLYRRTMKMKVFL